MAAMAEYSLISTSRPYLLAKSLCCMTEVRLALTVGIVSVPTVIFRREAGAGAAADAMPGAAAPPAPPAAGGAAAVGGAAGAQATTSTRTNSAGPQTKWLDRRSLSHIVPPPALTSLRAPNRSSPWPCKAQGQGGRSGSLSSRPLVRLAAPPAPWPVAPLRRA